MFNDLRELVAAYKARDPAARSTMEVLLLYPGVKAVRSHRKAHWCYEHGYMFLARLISQRSRRRTGIEIHPGAKIGKRLVIDQDVDDPHFEELLHMRAQLSMFRNAEGEPYNLVELPLPDAIYDEDA